MRILDPVLIRLPTGHMAFAAEVRFDPGEDVKLERARPGETLLAIVTSTLRGGFDELLSKGEKVEETHAKLSNGDIAANEDPDGVPSVGGNTGSARHSSLPSTAVVSPAHDPADLPGEAGARTEGATRQVAVHLEAAAPSHVRVFRGPHGRRLSAMDPVPHSETLCGAPITSLDLTPLDAKRDLRAGWKWLGCEKCRALVERSAASPSTRRSRAAVREGR